jgi:hypothetical protein
MEEMGNNPDIPHNPLIEKRKAAAETLNRRQRKAAEFAAKLADDRCAFFDRLALLAAGALTFSVTLLGHTSQPHPHRLFVLYVAWLLLLLSLGSCLLRNYSNQAHRFYSVGTNRAESEVAVIDADTEAVAALSGWIKYADAAEPFDKDRELRINRENREVWQQEFERNKKKAESHWKLSEAAEWTAGVSMLLGFLLLIAFAVVSTYLQ